ncbi:MAG: hypothetical protein JWO31_831, partial [Phycisphaerales bacterium]|nr:hypothetical protein [Phycisphaerales bacterium]
SYAGDGSTGVVPAGVPAAGRPVFLKLVYHGPRAMEELAAYDPHLVPGILGGSSGTTYDAFKLLTEAKKYGARAALFGRKINNSEHQLTFVSFLRLLADEQITAEEATKAYHGELQKLGIKPIRPLAEDSRLTTTATSYAGDGSTGVVPAGVPAAEPLAEAKPIGTTAVPLRPAPTAVPPSPARRGSSGSSASAGGNGDRPKVRVTFSGSAGPGGAGRRPTFSGGGSGGNEPRGRTGSPVVGRAAVVNLDRPVAAVGATTPPAASGVPRRADGSPDFPQMTPAQKVAAARQKIQADLARDRAG